MKTFPKTNGIFGVALLVALGLGLPGAPALGAASDVNCDGCVDTGDIGDNAITSKKIKDRSVKATDLHKSAKPAGQVSSRMSGATVVNGVDQIIMTSSLVAPEKGFGVAMASWYFSGTNATGRCSVTTGNAVQAGNLVAAELRDQTNYMPGSMVQSFNLEKGLNRIRLVCDATVGSVSIYDPRLIVMFVPQLYSGQVAIQ